MEPYVMSAAAATLPEGQLLDTILDLYRTPDAAAIARMNCARLQHLAKDRKDSDHASLLARNATDADYLRLLHTSDTRASVRVSTDTLRRLLTGDQGQAEPHEVLAWLRHASKSHSNDTDRIALLCDALLELPGVAWSGQDRPLLQYGVAVLAQHVSCPQQLLVALEFLPAWSGTLAELIGVAGDIVTTQAG